MKLSDFKGKVSQCNVCTNHDPAKPMPCNRCFCRGYVAECLNCQGVGQIEEPVAGAMKGNMKVTCPVCGGKKVFPTTKPADWDITHPKVEEPQEAEVVA